MSKKHILIFTKYTEKGPSSRYRSFQYRPFLEKEFILSFYPLFDDGYLDNLYKNKRFNYLQIVRSYLIRIFWVFKYLGTEKIVFVEYELLPYFPPLLEFLFYKTKVKVVLDYDDAIFHNYDKHNNIIVRTLLRNKIKSIAKYADLIIVGSPYLSKYFINYNNNVIEIPTSITFEKYMKHSPNIFVSNLILVGWIGSKTTSENILFIREVIKKIELLYPQILFKLMGFDTHLKPEINFSNVEFCDWTKENEISFLNSIDIGIMPLIDTPFNRGKCGFKLIQYMAAGKPTISTPLEANVKINRDSDNMFASSIEEWLVCFEKFTCNYEYYKKVGMYNRDIIEQYYSVEVNSCLYIDYFKNLYHVRN